MSFVSCRLIARTGNQLFITAAAIGTALRNGVEYKIPRETSSRREWPCYIQHLPEYKGEKIDFVYEEPKDFSYAPIPYQPNMMISGYFQSEKHFVDYRKEILEAFNFRYEFKKDWVGIHVRHGDYLRFHTKHPPVTLNYIAQAIYCFKNAGFDRFMVFSDGMEWCKAHINSTIFWHCEFEYSEGRSVIEDITLMSHCEHQIIANSTFSWWAAWLNRNENKVVITPHESNWFGPDNSHLKADDIIPKNWIRIKY